MSKKTVVLIVAWGLGALALTLSGAVARAPRAVIPLLLIGPVVAFFWAARRPGAARRLAAGLDLRLAVGLHVLRIGFGVGFLVAAARGIMPASLAVPAGWGDLVVGLLALGALAALPRSPGLVIGWNLVALADILAVVIGAQRIIVFGDPGPAFFSFPFPLLPLFVVPIVLITHGIVHARLTGRYAT